ncbi:hypothetical protein AK51_06935 [Serratia nematodiphila DZ0503SBS1]|nr:hypothetical protein AK51_06935 [Serratia nematodiphila DZ0503SBS1]
MIGTFSPLTGRVTSWPSVVEHCELFVAFGGLALKNAQVSSGGAAEHALKPWLQKLARKGTPVVNISPMRDDCPEFVNAEWIPIRPNTDVALMLALAYEIQRLGAQDEAFLHSHCVGYQQLADYLNGVSDGVAKRRPGPAPSPAFRRRASRCCAATDRRAQFHHLFLLCATCASGGATVLDDDRAIGDAGPGGAAGRRFLVRPRLNEWRRQSARGYPRADHASRG